MNGDMMEMLNLALGVPNGDNSSNFSMLIAALSQISARTRTKGAPQTWSSALRVVHW